MCLRLCLRVAKIRTFAPLLVPLRCAGTIALLSDFCSAGWAAPAAFLSQGIISNTPQDFAGCLRFYPTLKIRDFPAGTPFVPAALPHKVSSLCCGTLRGPRCVYAKEKCKTCACSAFFALLKNYPPRTHFSFAGWAAPAACSFLRTSGFCVVARTGFSPFANAIFSPSRKLKIFTRGPRSALRELRTQIRWRKIRYSVAALLTNPKSSGSAKESNCRMHS